MCHCNYATAKTLIVRDGTCAYAHTDTSTRTKKKLPNTLPILHGTFFGVWLFHLKPNGETHRVLVYNFHLFNIWLVYDHTKFYKIIVICILPLFRCTLFAMLLFWWWMWCAATEIVRNVAALHACVRAVQVVPLLFFRKFFPLYRIDIFIFAYFSKEFPMLLTANNSILKSTMTTTPNMLCKMQWVYISNTRTVKV